MSKSPFGEAVDEADDHDSQQERVLACAHLAGRVAAREFQIGHLHDDVPAAEAGWWASVLWSGIRLSSGSDHRSPGAAADALAKRLLDGGKCRCGRMSTTNPAGAYGGDKITVLGEKWSHAEQVAAGFCVWQRNGERWESSCDAPPVALTAEQALRLGRPRKK